MRRCGDCKECCTAMNHTHSARGVACQYECSTGCSIYQSRPDDCRGFACVWLEGQLPRKDRPDLSGIMVIREATEFGLTTMVHETREGASKRGRGASLIQRLHANTGETMLVLKLKNGATLPLNDHTIKRILGTFGRVKR